MSNIKAPILTIKGKKYSPIRPKVRNWYKFAEFEDKMETMGVPEYITGVAKLISDMYPGVKPDEILDNVDIAEFKPLYIRVYRYIVQMTNAAMASIPKNGQAGAD